MAPGDSSDSENQWLEYLEKTHEEIEQLKKDYQEVELMLQQSRIELDRLARQNASVTANLQRTLGAFETVPREELREAYEAALDSQQRLFVMRGQVEKLQSTEKLLGQLLEKIEEFQTLAGQMGQRGAGLPLGGKSAVEMVEMVIQAQEAERQRLSRKMHDGPAQALSNFILQADIAMRLFDIDLEKAKEELVNLKNSASKAFSQVREFIFEIRPMMLDDLGLLPTLRRYIEAVAEQSHLNIKLTTSGGQSRIESYLEVMLFRAIQELLNNAIHHSKASEIQVWLDISDTFARVAVEDNGKGFNLDEIAKKSGMGLKVTKERVEMLGGEFSVDSAENRGSRISFQIPIIQTTH